MTRSLLFVTVLAMLGAGCGNKPDKPPATTGESAAPMGSGSAAPTPAPTPAAGSGAAPSPAIPTGWTRTDLSTLPNPLPVSIALPPNAKVVPNEPSKQDDKGQPITAPRVRITVDTWWLELTYNEHHRTLANTKEMHARPVPPHKLVGEKTLPDGTWIVAAEASDGHLFVDSVHPATDVACSTMLVPATQQQAIFDICLSMAFSTKVPPVTDDASYAFEGLAADRNAQRAAAAVQQAILAEDGAAFVALIAPQGLELDGKQLTREALTAKLATAKLQAVLRWACSADDPCTWDAPGMGDTEFGLSRTSGYGKQRTMRFAKQPDGSWRVASVSTVDLGEP